MDELIGTWDKPIGNQVSVQQLCTQRHIEEIYLGNSHELACAMGCNGPFWGRLYVLWSNNGPLCVLHEVLSNKLLGDGIS